MPVGPKPPKRARAASSPANRKGGRDLPPVSRTRLADLRKTRDASPATSSMVSVPIARPRRRLYDECPAQWPTERDRLHLGRKVKSGHLQPPTIQTCGAELRSPNSCRSFSPYRVHGLMNVGTRTGGWKNPHVDHFVGQGIDCRRKSCCCQTILACIETLQQCVHIVQKGGAFCAIYF
jgi:hypothetical protein